MAKYCMSNVRPFTIPISPSSMTSDLLGDIIATGLGVVSCSFYISCVKTFFSDDVTGHYVSAAESLNRDCEFAIQNNVENYGPISCACRELSFSALLSARLLTCITRHSNDLIVLHQPAHIRTFENNVFLFAVPDIVIYHQPSINHNIFFPFFFFEVKMEFSKTDVVQLSSYAAILINSRPAIYQTMPLLGVLISPMKFECFAYTANGNAVGSKLAETFLFEGECKTDDLNKLLRVIFFAAFKWNTYSDSLISGNTNPSSLF